MKIIAEFSDLREHVAVGVTKTMRNEKYKGLAFCRSNKFRDINILDFSATAGSIWKLTIMKRRCTVSRAGWRNLLY